MYMHVKSSSLLEVRVKIALKVFICMYVHMFMCTIFIFASHVEEFQLCVRIYVLHTYSFNHLKCTFARMYAPECTQI